MSAAATDVKKQMTLMLFMAPTGYYEPGWRLPESRVEEYFGLKLVADVARRAEAAKLHAVFLGDWLSFGASFGSDAKNVLQPGYEPITTVAALSGVTERIGLVATAATTFMEPFHLARFFSQMDWLSNGRVGWNIVTATHGQENFNVEFPRREERYARAYEYMDVVTGLWNAWAKDAVLNDRENGVWADLGKIKPLNHQGERYKVAGPLMLPRSPQGRPVLFQAGASDAGKDFAARFAEVVFTVAPTLPVAQGFYADLKSRVVQAGRDASSLRIHPGMMPIVGSDEEDAKRIHGGLLDLVDLNESLSKLSMMLEGVDLTGLDQKDVIPPERLVDPVLAVKEKDATTRYPYFHHLAVEKKYTVRMLLQEVMKAAGHNWIVGGPEQIADHMQLWFESGAVDGFGVLPPTVPTGLNRFLDEVVPILQDRGLFRTEYVDGTLRDNLGLEPL